MALRDVIPSASSSPRADVDQSRDFSLPLFSSIVPMSMNFVFGGSVSSLRVFASSAVVRAAVSSVMQQSGRIDVLVNNAGIAELGPLADIPVSTFQSVFNTNVTGVLTLTQAVFPHMAKQHSGCVLNISSVAGTLYA